MNPETLQALASVAVAAMSLVITVAAPLVQSYVKNLTGIKIEEKHMKALHEAGATWARDAVKRGIQPATTDLADDFYEYALESVPDALSSLKPKKRVLGNIAQRYLG